MKGNKLFKVLRTLSDHATGRLQDYLESRTHRQRIRIVLVLFALFAIADILFIVKGCSGSPLPEIEHLQPLNP